MRTTDYFITGTDTGVGKSLLSSALLMRLGASGRRCIGMKPVAAGVEEINGQWLNEDVVALQAASTIDAPLELRCPYMLRAAISPHLAASLEGVSLSLDRIRTAYEQLAALTDAVVVEGAGGFRVPLGDDLDGADLAVALGLPVILVVGMRLGCLNHALLTYDAIRARGLSVAAWVACRITPDMNAIEQNVQTLRRRIDAPLLGDIPWLEQADARTAAQVLDMTVLQDMR